MFFTPCPDRHAESLHTTTFPPLFRTFRIQGARTNCHTGAYGMLLSQFTTVLRRSITLHHFFLDHPTCLLFTMNNPGQMLLYNYGPPCSLQWINKKNNEMYQIVELAPKDFCLLDSDPEQSLIRVEKGHYTLIGIDGSHLVSLPLLQNKILGHAATNNLHFLADAITSWQGKPI